MKSNRKIVTDRPIISKNEILEQKQPFNEIVKNFYSSSIGISSGFSSLLGWGIGGLSILVVGIILYITEFSPSDNNSDIAVMEQTDTNATEIVYADTLTKREIAPPYPELVTYETFKIKNNKKPISITTKNGSKIDIPANAFVDANGEAITKDIEIKFRDFYNPLDFFISGIPMDYDSAGANYTFTSAGMFEIDAKSKDKQLYLKGGEKIDLEFNSLSASTYNFYEYDTTDNEWTYQFTENQNDIKDNNLSGIGSISESSNKNNPDIETSELKKTTSINNTIPIASTSTDETNLDNQDDNKTKKPTYESEIVRLTDNQDIEVRKLMNYSFQLNKSMLSGTKYENLDSLLLEIKPSEKFNEAYYTVLWDEIKLLETDQGLELNLIKGKQKIKYAASPVIEPESYLDAKQTFEKNSQESEKKRTVFANNKNEKTKIYNSTSTWVATRNIQIMNLGLYNCDRPLPEPQFAQKGKRIIIDQNNKQVFYREIFVTQVADNVLWKYTSLNSWQYSGHLQNVAWISTNDGQLAIIYPNKFNPNQDDFCLATIYPTNEGLKQLSKLIN